LSVLDVEGNCWRVERAPRAALLIDMAEYFLAAKAAIRKARRSVHMLNWAFDPATLLDPQPGGVGPEDDRFGPFLKGLACDRPELDIRILCWKSALPVSATQRFFPHRAKECFEGTPVHFLLDATVPLGACHHQKMIVVDDEIAFCGGGDIGPDRWDTMAHLDDDPRRQMSKRNQKEFMARHEMMSVVDGPIAAALGEHFRNRWQRATGHVLVPTPPTHGDAWPDCIVPDLRGVGVGIARTQPAWRGYPEVRESEALYVDSIAAAKTCIYMENQYFTSPLVAEALADRLAEPDGPEVVLVSTVHSPSWFDQMTMDRTRSMFIKHLRAADRHGRLHTYVPVTEQGKLIIVHAKMAIIDDTLLRVGSTNMNNRSSGFDTECDVCFEADDDDAAARTRIGQLRTRLIAHWLGCPPALVQSTQDEAGGVGAGIEHLRSEGHRRLKPLEPKSLGPLATFIAAYHLGDPIGTSDSWQPWRRRAALAARQAAFAQSLRDKDAQARHPASCKRP
jgi:phosphatidylserine/phosphatidylglycerophosphate/cardiolipin synthase-like enzyme